MGWITLAEARLGANTSASTNVAAKLIATWLYDRGAGFDISHTHPTETTFSRDGISVVQERDVKVIEYRALSQDLADFLAQYLNENNTQEWPLFGVTANGDSHMASAIYGPPASSTGAWYTYYKGAGATSTVENGGSSSAGLGYNFYPPTTGTAVDAISSRSNAADGWMVRVTTTQYICPNYQGARATCKAFLPFPPAAIRGGVVVSDHGEKTFVAYDGNTPVYQNVNTIVREYRYLTQSQASNKVSSEKTSNSRTFDVRVAVSWGTSGTTYKNISVRGGGNNGLTAATDKVAVSRPMGGGLYVVSVNEVTYQVTNS